MVYICAHDPGVREREREIAIIYYPNISIMVVLL